LIYSKSSQYAIRALQHLAMLSAGSLCRLEEIASEEQIPRHFLAKILQRLAKKRLVRSFKGLGGGFTLGHPAKNISLYMIVDAIDDLSFSFQECIFGDRICGEAKPCALHDDWARLREEELKFLQRITVANLITVQSKHLK
jgi:Rrf2 family transcriptional regulator, iron-sulfur cluster assembly transcription factor